MNQFTNAELVQLSRILAQDERNKQYRAAYNKRPEVRQARKAYRQTTQFKAAQHARNARRWELTKMARKANEQGLI